MHISLTRYAKLGEQAADAAARKFLVNRRFIPKNDTSPLDWGFQDIKWYQTEKTGSLKSPTFQVRVKGMVGGWMVKIHVQLVEPFWGAPGFVCPIWILDKVIVYDDMNLGIAEEWTAKELGFPSNPTNT